MFKITHNINDMLWVEKYRPRKINQIITQEQIKNFLIGALKTNNIQNLLLHGPAGSGKTTFANVLIKHFFTLKKQNYPLWSETTLCIENSKLKSERILELNASDERGIKTVRETIKSFASHSIDTTKLNIPPFKIIILDEADAMNDDAQYALRRIMEIYAHNTRFILICNHVTKIIPPLISRCSSFRFLPVGYVDSKRMIENILQQEFNKEIILTDELYMYIYKWGAGDMRKIITLFQQLTYNNEPSLLTINIVQEIVGEIPKQYIDNIINILQQPLTTQTQTDIYKLCIELLDNGFNILLVLNHLYRNIIFTNCFNISDINKQQIINKLSDIDNRLNTGCHELIQLLDMCLYINCIVNNKTITIDPITFTINW